MSGENGTTPGGAAEALKRIKAAEREWDAQLSSAKGRADEEAKRLEIESAAAVKSAQTEAERARYDAVQAARLVAEREAEEIESAGAREAGNLESSGRGIPAAKRPAVLDAILGEFRA